MSRLIDSSRRSPSRQVDARKLCTGSTIILALCVLCGAVTAVLMLVVRFAGAA